MRSISIIVAVILTTSLIFIFTLPCSAAATEVPLYWQSANISYDAHQNPTIYENIYPEGDPPKLSSIPYIKDVDGISYKFNDLVLVFCRDDGEIFEYEKGYIYTYNFTIRVTNVADLDQLEFEFAVGQVDSDDVIIRYSPVGDIIYNYTKQASRNYTFNISVTLDVTDDFFVNIPQGTDINSVVMIQILNYDSAMGGTFHVTNSSCKYTKAVGENAYYQASLDAIQNLPESEYEYIYKSMPNSEGEIDVIKGDILDIISVYDSDVQQLKQALSIEQARPVVYLPEVQIPFLDVYVFNNQFFYVDEYLNSMHPNIMTNINYLVVFIRLVLFVTFSTVTIYKFARIEWWY